MRPRTRTGTRTRTRNNTRTEIGPLHNQEHMLGSVGVSLCSVDFALIFLLPLRSEWFLNWNAPVKLVLLIGLLSKGPHSSFQSAASC